MALIGEVESVNRLVIRHYFEHPLIVIGFRYGIRVCCGLREYKVTIGRKQSGIDEGADFQIMTSIEVRRFTVGATLLFPPVPRKPEASRTRQQQLPGRRFRHRRRNDGSDVTQRR